MKSQEIENQVKLTDKQERFCYEYCIDFNKTQAALRAGYSEKTAYSTGHDNMKKPEIKARIEQMQRDLAKTAGISALRIIKEHEKIAFADSSQLRDGWMKLKEFESISAEAKASIQSIETKSQRIMVDDAPVEEVYIKVKMYDKQKSLDSLCRILGFDAVKKLEVVSTQPVVIEKKYDQ